jgi:hypothetical protein
MRFFIIAFCLICASTSKLSLIVGTRMVRLQAGFKPFS